MPKHIHCIIQNAPTMDIVETNNNAIEKGAHVGEPYVSALINYTYQKIQNTSICDAMNWFKTLQPKNVSVVSKH